MALTMPILPLSFFPFFPTRIDATSRLAGTSTHRLSSKRSRGSWRAR
jgi:hypothetical protein